MKLHETTGRSVVKTVTYRILLITSGGLITYLFTHDSKLTFEITAISNVVATILYFLHERFWNKVHWGKVVKK